MVKAVIARRDIDNYHLRKTCTYTKYTDTEDLSSGSLDRGTPSTYTIKCQLEIVGQSSDWVKSGLLNQGELIGLLRYEYTEESDGTAISPTLTPKLHDEITFNSETWRITNLDPSTSEENDIIAYVFTGTTMNSNVM